MWRASGTTLRSSSTSADAIARGLNGTLALNLSNGKLAMWMFLGTEIMFFVGLIGTYIILRNGQPRSAWPTPEQVHLVEWIGADNPAGLKHGTEVMDALQSSDCIVW